MTDKVKKVEKKHEWFKKGSCNSFYLVKIRGYVVPFNLNVTMSLVFLSRLAEGNLPTMLKHL